MNHRPLRVGKLIQKELGKILEREVETPGTLVTITESAVDKKLEHAKILVSVFPEGNAADALQVLERVRGKLQFLLMKKLHIKPMPRIEFVIDRGPEHAARVEKLLLKNE